MENHPSNPYVGHFYSRSILFQHTSWPILYTDILDTSWYILIHLDTLQPRKKTIGIPIVSIGSDRFKYQVPITSQYWTCHPLAYPPGLPNDRWQGRESMCLRGRWLGAWQWLHREDGFLLWHFCQDGCIWRHKSEFRNKDVKWCKCRGPIGLRPSCHIYELSTSIYVFTYRWPEVCSSCSLPRQRGYASCRPCWFWGLQQDQSLQLSAPTTPDSWNRGDSWTGMATMMFHLKRPWNAVHFIGSIQKERCPGCSKNLKDRMPLRWTVQWTVRLFQPIPEGEKIPKIYVEFIQWFYFYAHLKEIKKHQISINCPVSFVTTKAPVEAPKNRRSGWNRLHPSPSAHGKRCTVADFLVRP